MHFDNKGVVRTDIPTQRVASHTIVAKRLWMKTPLGTEVDLRAARPHCTRRVASAPRKAHSMHPPLLGPRLLWPRSPISATAELLYIMKLCSRLFVLYCRNCPKDDKFR